MKNYLCINGKKIPLTKEQIDSIKSQFVPQVKLGDATVGETVEIGEYEFIVLEHQSGNTYLLMRDFLEIMEFGKSNDYKSSDVKNRLDKFADEIAEIVGEENICMHSVDLTADDGLKCYGSTMARVSLLTCNLYRKYVEILDKYKVKDWWWLATPFSTPKHGYSETVKCVSPAGDVLNCYGSFNDSTGVRPFCILDSDIFVS
ncbi:MAG: hypothetical protein IJA60_02765 [Clostridia bacterium]|nr:hypothetical protein [Clostridia bacterium]